MHSKVLDSFIISNSKITYKEYHVARTYEALSFLDSKNVNLETITALYENLEKKLSSAETDDVFRLTVDPVNPENSKLEVRKLISLPVPVKLHAIIIQEKPTDERRFKWADRSYWDSLLKSLPQNYDDVLLVDTENSVIETARCNVYFYDVVRDLVLTPPLQSGCLNGVLRRFFMNSGFIDLPKYGLKKISEENLTLGQIQGSDTLFIGNAVRGLLKASV